jgi:hypothetical protein
VKVPPELVKEWAQEIYGSPGADTGDVVMANKAAQWAADQELEACCEWLRSQHHSDTWPSRLRTVRRTKPLTLAERALEQYERVEDILLNHDVIPAGCIRTALTRLAELEAQQ